MAEVYVVGHKNPDTDSICSAIAYANYKNLVTGTEDYHAYRAGKINEETQFVLKKWGLEVPPLLQDLRPQVKDLAIKNTDAIKSTISIKNAWKLMNEAGVVTLPVVKNRKLEGIITITDIATSYMDVYDTNVLETSKTSYKQIAETLDGKIAVGSDKYPYVSGKVVTGVATPEIMEEQIAQGDIVILGNRYEAQLCAIEMGAGCIVVCDKAPISITISKRAQDNGCTVISSPHDAFTVSRLIYQSIPVDFVMRKTGLIAFSTEDFVDDIKKVMTEKRHRDFPILDKHGHYVGMISRRSLLGASRKQVVMVDHNEEKQAVPGIASADILEIVDHHRLSSIETITPVFFRNQPVGCTSTIIYDLYTDSGVEISPLIAKVMCSAIISDTIMFRSPTCTPLDKEVGTKLAKIAGINIEEYAHEMFFAGSNISEKSAKELFSGDYKKFTIGELTFGIGQVSCIDGEELSLVKKKIYTYMKEQYKALGVKMLFFMLTDMMKQSTELLFVGDGAEELVTEAFDIKPVDNAVVLPGVVSRKKQIVPQLMTELSQ